MRNELPKRFAGNIQVTPEVIVNRKGSEVYDDLANTLIMLEPTKAVVLDKQEAITLFGKTYAANVPFALKKRKVTKVKVCTRDNKVYIWSTKI